MLYSVRVGSRQAVPNKLIWFSDAVWLFVVEWRQNEPFTPYADKNLTSQYSTGNDELCKLYDWLMANKLSQGFKKSNYVIFRPRHRNVTHEVNLKIYNHHSNSFTSLERKVMFNN